MAPVTYKKSGVDVDRGNRFVESIKSITSKTHGPNVLTGIGGFGALYKIPMGKYKNPVFVSSTDGVGTKLKCSASLGKYEMLGEDLVAMNVNDILTSGAEPLFFLDYIAVGRLHADRMRAVLTGIAKGCKQSGCSLIGGETAEMPGVYRRDDFDLAGFAVGIVDQKKMLTPQLVRRGDVIVGLASNGIHANGFSLVRKVLSKSFIAKHADEVLRPTRIYVKPITQLMKRVKISGMAHITGGGFYDNVPRMLPKGLGALIHAGSWRIPRVFKWIQKKSGTSFKEMHRTFNMGIGYMVVVPKKHARRTLSCLAKMGVDSWLIGEVTKSDGVTIQ